MSQSIEGSRFELATILGILGTYIIQKHAYGINYKTAFKKALKLVNTHRIPITIIINRDNGTRINASDLCFNFL